MSEPPEDVKVLLEELKKKGLKPSLVAVEKTPETYEVWRDGRYAGTLPSDEVYREKDLVACGKLTCSVFVDDAMKYAWEREKRRLHEPEEW